MLRTITEQKIPIHGRADLYLWNVSKVPTFDEYARLRAFNLKKTEYRKFLFEKGYLLKMAKAVHPLRILGHIIPLARARDRVLEGLDLREANS